MENNIEKNIELLNKIGYVCENRISYKFWVTEHETYFFIAPEYLNNTDELIKFIINNEKRYAYAKGKNDAKGEIRLALGIIE